MLGGRVAFNTRSMTLSLPIQHGPRSSIAVFAFLSREGWFGFALLENQTVSRGPLFFVLRGWRAERDSEPSMSTAVCGKSSSNPGSIPLQPWKAVSFLPPFSPG